MKVGDKVLYTDENGKKFDSEVVRVIDETKQCSVHILGTTKDAELISQDSCEIGKLVKVEPEPAPEEKKEASGEDSEPTKEPEESKSEKSEDESATEGDSPKTSG